MSFKTGFSKICITPPLGSPICGYYNERLTKGALDDLYVRAAAFDDGETKAVILAVDVCLLNKKQCDEYRKMISDFTGIDFNNVFITCSHTHTGPVIGKDFASPLETIPAYLCILAMPLFYSISEGICFGVVSYVLLNLFTGKKDKVAPLMYILAVLFVLKYIFL